MVDMGIPGERGQQGDHGQAGSPGEPGEQGAHGDQGSVGKAGPAGERGMQGDHGQDGDQGIAGLPGERGRDGQTGLAGLPGERGAPGDSGQIGVTGDTGVAGPSPTSRLLVMFVLMMVAFLVLAVRSEINADNISDNNRDLDRFAQEQCEQRSVNVARLNIVYTGLIAIEKKSLLTERNLTEIQDIRSRIDLYSANKFIVPICGPRR